MQSNNFKHISAKDCKIIHYPFKHLMMKFSSEARFTIPFLISGCSESKKGPSCQKTISFHIENHYQNKARTSSGKIIFHN